MNNLYVFFNNSNHDNKNLKLKIFLKTLIFLLNNECPTSNESPDKYYNIELVQNNSK